MRINRKSDKKTLSLFVQIILSVWIIIHALAVLITPNRNTYLGTKFSRWMEPYSNFLELSANWNFFAPQPGPPMRLEFEAISSDGNQLAHGFWPNLSSPWRQTTLSHFILKESVPGEQIVGNFLCHEHPGAHAIQVWRNIYRIPSLEEVASRQRAIGDESRVVRQFIGTWNCKKSASTESTL